MMRLISLVLVFSVANARHMNKAENEHLLALSLEPELVSSLFRDVEHSWVEKAVTALADSRLEHSMEKEMFKSCSKVAQSVVQGSDGERERVQVYMTEVCGEKILQGEDVILCHAFADGIVGSMIADDQYNRDELDVNAFCEKLWNGAVQEVASRKKKELDSKTQEKQKWVEERRVAEQKAKELEKNLNKEEEELKKKKEQMEKKKVVQEKKMIEHPVKLPVLPKKVEKTNVVPKKVEDKKSVEKKVIEKKKSAKKITVNTAAAAVKEKHEISASLKEEKLHEERMAKFENDMKKAGARLQKLHAKVPHNLRAKSQDSKSSSIWDKISSFFHRV